MQTLKPSLNFGPEQNKETNIIPFYDNDVTFENKKRKFIFEMIIKWKSSHNNYEATNKK